MCWVLCFNCHLLPLAAQQETPYAAHENQGITCDVSLSGREKLHQKDVVTAELGAGAGERRRHSPGHRYAHPRRGAEAAPAGTALKPAPSVFTRVHSLLGQIQRQASYNGDAVRWSRWACTPALPSRCASRRCRRACHALFLLRSYQPACAAGAARFPCRSIASSIVTSTTGQCARTNRSRLLPW